jgi:hypothetical protein
MSAVSGKNTGGPDLSAARARGARSVGPKIGIGPTPVTKYADSYLKIREQAGSLAGVED